MRPPDSFEPAARFTDACGCQAWLAALPLTDVPRAHAEILGQLEAFNLLPLPPLERLKILELLREPVAYVQGELAKKYLNKPIPLAAAESAAWDGVAALWRAMAWGYRYCLQGCSEDAAGLAAQAAQRTLSALGRLVLEHFQACRQVPPALWRELHLLYALCERRGIAAVPVEDRLNPEGGTGSCQADYAKALLLDLAGPYQLSGKQLAQMDRWLDKWSARVDICAERPPTPTLALVAADLDGERGPVVLAREQRLSRPRYLDTELMSISMRKRIKFLRSGGSPTRLDLGADYAQPACGAFLSYLHQRWCEAEPERQQPRQPAQGAMQLCFGLAAAHYFLSGEKPFRQPGEEARLARGEFAALQMFGHARAHSGTLRQSGAEFALEAWRQQDQSAAGLHLSAASGARGEGRLRRGQLLLVRPEAGAQFVLGSVRWLMSTAEGGLDIGVHTLPGVPLAVAVRPRLLGPDGRADFELALLLPELPALQRGASLILPVGRYAAGRVLEIDDGRHYAVRLKNLLERGCDYDCADFVPA